MMQQVKSKEKSIKDLLDGKKYGLDFYQREYVWTDKEVSELIKDLADEFHRNYDEAHDRTEVEKYGHYFLGSIVIREINTRRYIIDGQQRLTTLTLLLIFLYHSLEDENQKGQVVPMIYSMQFGKKSFNLDIPERKLVMDALLSNESLDSFEDDKSESIRNILRSYKQIQKNPVFTQDMLPFQKTPVITQDMLPYFVDWLLEKVDLVEIIAVTEEHAYTVFETMNDRALRLTNTEMLRGNLLSNITETEHRDIAKRTWDESIQKLKELGRDEESEAIKAWLRSQYSNTYKDFDRIGAVFHRWMRDPENKNKLGLVSSESYQNLINKDFTFFVSWYHRLREAASSLTIELENIFYNAQNDFTLQFPILLSPLRIDDTEKEALSKLHIVSTYLDILIHRRLWNGDTIARNTMDNYIWRDQIRDNNDPITPLIPSIRCQTSEKLMDILYNRLIAETDPIGSRILHLQNNNKKKLRLILARIIHYIEAQSKYTSRFEDYIKVGKNSYEIEHIWANHFEWYSEEFSHPFEFESYRNRIGGLLLLPKNKNISYGDSRYKEKRDYYLGENLLAKSLHENAYRRNPGFRQFLEKSKLPFQSHTEFKKADLDERQKLYQSIAERIWNPDRIKLQYGQEPDNVNVENMRTYTVLSEQDGESETFTADQISKSVPAEQKESYLNKYPSQKMYECYSMIAELQTLVFEKEWTLDLKFRNNYCAFYFADRRLFGIDLYSSPRFAVWLTEVEVDRFREICDYANYSSGHRRAVYPKNTKVEMLIPILEFAYKKHSEN